MEGLEKYYSGDDSWNKFAAYYLAEVDDKCLFERLIKELNGYKDLAAVIIGIFGDEKSIEWIKSHPKVLGGITAIQCTENENLVNRLREGLMRMPV